MIKKFNTFEEAQKDLWVMNPDSKYYARVRNFYALASVLVKTKFKRGVFKFKTIEEANRHRENLSKE